MSTTFFQIEIRDGTEVFLGNDAARGPWDPGSCHAGPPTALLARACERAVTRSDAERAGAARFLVRLTVDLARPIPMNGFTVTATIDRIGRAAATSAVLADLDGQVRVRAVGLHLQPSQHHPYPTAKVRTPDLAESKPGGFPIQRTGHGLPGFSSGVEMRYPPGHDPDGEWFGTEVVSHWEPNGIDLADALLFDHLGPVGRAVQTVLLRKQT